MKLVVCISSSEIFKFLIAATTLLTYFAVFSLASVTVFFLDFILILKLAKSAGNFIELFAWTFIPAGKVVLDCKDWVDM